MSCLRSLQRLRPLDGVVSGHTRVTFCTSIGLQRSAVLNKNVTTVMQPQTVCSAFQIRSISFGNDLSKLPKSHPEHGDLAYIGTISNMVKFVKTFSLSTSVIGLAAQPYVFFSMDQLPIWLKGLLTGSLSFFIFVTPLLIHFITSRYVLHLYYRPDTGVFTATTYNLFVREKSLQFTSRDVEFPEIHGILSTVNVKGKPLFMDPSQFLNRKVYIKMMSYDQPMDWQVGLEKESKIESKFKLPSDTKIEIPIEHLKGMKNIGQESRKSL